MSDRVCSVRTLPISGSSLGPPIKCPRGIALDLRSGKLRIFFSDSDNHRIAVLEDGVLSTVVGFSGRPGFKDGPVSEAQLNAPDGIVLDERNGDLIFCDWGNHRVRVLSNGAVHTLVGAGVEGYREGPLSESFVSCPTGIARDASSGDIFYCDAGNNRIRVVRGGKTELVAGTGPRRFKDGNVDEAELNFLSGLTFDPLTRDLIFSDESHRIRRISDGVVSTVIGCGGQGGYQDGLPSLSRVNAPRGHCFDPRNGDLYFCDRNSNAIRVLSSGFVSTLAGSCSPEQGLVDGPADVARFANPHSIAMDEDSATLYVTDRDNDAIRAIELVSSSRRSVEEYKIKADADPRWLMRLNRRGMTPLEMARHCNEGEDVVRFLDAQTVVVLALTEVHASKSDDHFRFWYLLWDEL